MSSLHSATHAHRTCRGEIRSSRASCRSIALRRSVHVSENCRMCQRLTSAAVHLATAEHIPHRTGAPLDCAPLDCAPLAYALASAVLLCRSWQGTLARRTRTSLIVNISPDVACREETLSSILFGRQRSTLSMCRRLRRLLVVCLTASHCCGEYASRQAGLVVRVLVVRNRVSIVVLGSAAV
jgi:hypothetical protein